MVTSHEVLLLSSPPSFLILFLLFICAIEFNELDSINTAEIVFMIYALGFTLEKVAAMQEHGIKGEYFYNRLSVKAYRHLPCSLF